MWTKNILHFRFPHVFQTRASLILIVIPFSSWDTECSKSVHFPKTLLQDFSSFLYYSSSSPQILLDNLLTANVKVTNYITSSAAVVCYSAGKKMGFWERVVASGTRSLTQSGWTGRALLLDWCDVNFTKSILPSHPAEGKDLMHVASSKMQVN